ncbi:3-hydroxyacyl-CoA dehydrogenase NAD-binding protein [Gemmatirosa kalamazoonensis]|uniref:3-hydroxyacyl-CoA dehydrogenase NAD-binding protein n=1 Tax=Gemmatirosa kalamazoonensis TaxID=861299 RepID=W0RLD7_9BACT|nr:3-hydroxyacyl-CoA dehydrogenase NAD-binding domain-containing protein [Gemmatirosa kalamazoonensis]AHG91247.1 3-hydroxyacyl-CoA dehydrogenase NAD-binding protein [Gemmatirosa kalamazoonensis]
MDQGTVVGVLGAGAMGTGIAQVALVRGHRVVLADARPDAAERASETLGRALAREVEKGRLTPAAANGAHRRLTIVRGTEDLAPFAECGLVIEAVVEDLGVKRESFRRLEDVVTDEAVLATNTSSLSVASIAGACRRPERVVGVHFFNPAPVLPLVEIVPALATSPAIAIAVRQLVDGWGKTTVLASDTPGFIVNRVARPFYGESLRLLDEGLADAATIDWAMRAIGGFRMGPFELMDFIGLDVNYAVTRSVYEATFHDPRYRPSLTQQRLVEAGRLGRKTGLGFYDYAEGAERPAATEDRALGERILRRVLAMLVNEAADAVYWRVASAADVEIAMTKGVNYPRGLLAWGDEIGADVILEEMEALRETYREDRYRPSLHLMQAVRDERSLLS